MKNTQNRILLTGPTASGKTSLALTLASKLPNVIIVNADSMQVYKGLEDLSCSPTVNEKKSYTHLLFNHLSINSSYSVAQWLQDVKEIIDNGKENNIIIVGGSVMYLHSLLNGIHNLPTITKETQDIIQQEFANKDITFLNNYLKKIDPQSAEIYKDHQRILKAIAIYLETKKTIHYWFMQPKKYCLNDYITHRFAIDIKRDQLYSNINARFHSVINNSNAIDEVKDLIKHPNYMNFNAINTIGVKEIIEYLNNNISKETLIAIGSQQTRRYAKRQITWFKNRLKKYLHYTSQENICQLFDA